MYIYIVHVHVQCFVMFYSTVKKTTTSTVPKQSVPKQQPVAFNPDDILKVKLGRRTKAPVDPPPPPPPAPETKSSDPDWAPKEYIEKGSYSIIRYICTHCTYLHVMALYSRAAWFVCLHYTCECK